MPCTNIRKIEPVTRRLRMRSRGLTGETRTNLENSMPWRAPPNTPESSWEDSSSLCTADYSQERGPYSVTRVTMICDVKAVPFDPGLVLSACRRCHYFAAPVSKGQLITTGCDSGHRRCLHRESIMAPPHTSYVADAAHHHPH